MKIIKYNSIGRSFLLLIFISSILLISCNSCNKDNNDDSFPNTDDTSNINDDPNDIAGLEFSNSPIDLEGILANYAKDINYGDFSDNTFDVFLPESNTPTSLVIFIHGGGFIGGSKNYFYSYHESQNWDFPEEIRTFLRNNIAVATINYRILKENDSEGVIKPLTDGKKCLQYIRYIDDLLNINKNKIALYGVSAGAGTSLWLAFHAEMADAVNADLVLQESTRVLGAAVLETQATYDLVRWATDVFSFYDVTFEELVAIDEQRVLSFYGINDINDIDSPEIIDYRASVDMLAMISADDPEYWASNIIREIDPPTNLGLVTHHAFHAKTLKEQADLIGLSNISYYGNPILFSDPSEETSVEYLIRKLTE